MKKIVLIVVLMFFVLSFSFEKNTTLNPKIDAKQTIMQEYLICSKNDPWYIRDVIYDKSIIMSLEEKFYKQNIPSEYYDAFIYHSRFNPEIRLAFYSIMVHESVNFKYFINRNGNGSYDIGPSQLNNLNLENKRFMDAYAPKDMKYVHTLYCYYMVITINFFKDMYHKYNLHDALYIYNGGEKAINILASTDKHVKKKYEKFIKNITSYNVGVTKCINKNTDRLNEFLIKEKNIYLTSLLIASNPSYCHQLASMRLRDQIIDINKFIYDGVDNIFTRQYLTNLFYEKGVIICDSEIRLLNENV